MENLLSRFGNTVLTAFTLSVLVLAPSAMAVEGDLLVYPAKDQTPEQQQKDEFECHQWAVEQSGYDPTRNQQVVQQEPAQGGGALKGAAGGALVGAGIGAIAGDAGKGAAIGGGLGAVGGGARKHQQAKQQEAATQQAQASRQAMLDRYNKAKSACLEGRGYTVK